MRKNILKAAFVAAMVAVAGYDVYANQQPKEELSDVMLANVEALADGEVIVEAICMGSSGICISYSDGYTIEGKRIG